LNIVYHAVVERVPEIFESSRFSTRHAKVATESSEIGLARHADGGSVRDVVGTVSRATIVA
jgi:hypothetical protein